MFPARRLQGWIWSVAGGAVLLTALVSFSRANRLVGYDAIRQGLVLDAMLVGLFGFFLLFAGWSAMRGRRWTRSLLWGASVVTAVYSSAFLLLGAASDEGKYATTAVLLLFAWSICNVVLLIRSR